jgi:general secretion pathway protein M
MNKLKAWYAALETREQRVVGIGAIALCVLILFGGILMPLQSAVSTAVKTKEQRREDLAWMRVNASEVQAGGASLPPDTGEAPVVLVRGTQPSGSGVRVQLEAAPFDTLITWLAALDERYGLAIETISVDRGSRPGLVNANITFTQAKH